MKIIITDLILSENEKSATVILILCVENDLRRLAVGWTVRGSNVRGGEIFRTRPCLPWDPPSLQYDGYWISFHGVMLPGHWR